MRPERFKEKAASDLVLFGSVLDLESNWLHRSLSPPPQHVKQKTILISSPIDASLIVISFTCDIFWLLPTYPHYNTSLFLWVWSPYYTQKKKRIESCSFINEWVNRMVGYSLRRLFLVLLFLYFVLHRIKIVLLLLVRAPLTYL